MPTQYGSNYVDERYSPIYEPNLFTKAWLIPEVTFTRKYQTGPAGGYYAHKIKNVSPIKPTLPTGKVTGHKETEGDLIKVEVNNDYKGSRQIPNAVAATVAAPVAEYNLRLAVEEVREGREYSALACLLTEGTESETKTALTKANIKDAILDESASLSEKKGMANVILCSPKTYSMLQSAAGAEFTPNRNENIQSSGRVADWYGYKIFECNQLSTPEDIEYFDYTTTKKVVAAENCNNVDFIMFYSEAFSCIDVLNNMRLIDTDPNYAGTYAQCFTLTGFRVTNSDLVRVRRHSA